MKAIVCTRYGKPDVLKLSECRTPEPASNQVLVQIHASSVTTSDCYIRGFSVPPLLKPLMGLVVGFGKPRQPILGMVWSGVVVQAGARVQDYRTGDCVYGFDRFGFGTYAEYKNVSQGDLIDLKPENLTHLQAASIPYGGLLAQYYLKKAQIQKRRRVLIIGASGSVGTSALQLAKHHQAWVAGICSTRNMTMVNELGADLVIDYTKDQYLNLNTRFDLILNCTPSAARSKAETRARYAHLLSDRGSYLSISSGNPSFTPRDLKELSGIAACGALKPVIDRIYSLADTSAAHEYVESWHKRGNVMIQVLHQ